MPLESTGTVHCVPGEGIVWNVTSPFPRTYAINRTGILSFKGDKISHASKDRTGISDAMLSLMSGAIAQYEKLTVLPYPTPTEYCELPGWGEGSRQKSPFEFFMRPLVQIRNC